MDDRYALDPVVMSVAASKLEASAEALATKVGTVEKEIEGTSTPGSPSPAHSFIGKSITAALKAKGVKIDGVLHGTFTQDPISAGEKTLGDIWKIIPYENMVVTAELSGNDVRAIYEEAINTSWSDRQLIGFEARVSGNSHGKYKLETLFAPDGEPVRNDRRYTLAFNSYDAQSGGNRMTRLRDLLAKPENKSEMHPIDTRSALVEYLSEQGSI
jgi:5'-nucleotidase / UDP-sugar diphosphatase